MGGLYDSRRGDLSIGGPFDRLAFEDGRTGRPQPEDDTMAQFMLLLHESPGDFADVSPAEIQRIIGEYTAWRERLEAAGRLVGGRKLKDEGGRHIRRVDGEVRVVDGPYAEAKEVLGGYFEIEAADYDEAIAVSGDCPHLRYGGRIELRQVDPIHD